MSTVSRKTLRVITICSISALIILSSIVQSIDAATPRQLVERSLRDLSSHTNQLVQQVQVYLQANGRWAPSPQGKDLQLCQALQSFQQAVGKTNRDNGSGSFSTIQNDFQQLQLQSQVVEQLINQLAQSPLVSTAWTQVRNDLAIVNQSLYSVPSFSPGNFYDLEAGLNPGMSTFQPGMPSSPFGNGMAPGVVPATPFYPGYRPTNINITENSTFNPVPTFQGTYSNYGPGIIPGMVPTGPNAHVNTGAISSLNSADSQSERFVKQLSGFLASRGKWPPAPGTPEMSLCQNVQSFQLQVRKLRSDMQSNQSFAVLQNEMQQVGVSSQNIDQLLMQVGATPDITSRWNEVRTSMNSAYQAFFSAGSGYIWMR